jgi:dihydroflavonol-4-reductase
MTTPHPGRVLVIGATGLLGSNVTAELLAAGAEVIAMARSAEHARRPLPAHERLRITEGDLTRIDGIAAQLRGADAIVHTAAYFREYYQPGGNDPAQLQRVNVDAVRQLLQAAADAGVPVMVHTSSSSPSRAVSSVPCPGPQPCSRRARTWPPRPSTPSSRDRGSKARHSRYPRA